MQKVSYQAEKKESQILIGESLKNLGSYAPLDRTVIITDKVVSELYKKDFPDCPVLEMEIGEQHKTIATSGMLYSKLLKLGCDRSNYIVGIGGGIVTDVTGFVASTFLRGLDFGFVSTTLLSQVDASVGGKNGVNHDKYKNMVGTFNQPDFVLCDTSMLATLPDEQIINGMAEVVKHAYIADKEMFDYLVEHLDQIKMRDIDVLSYLIHRSVEIKAAVVTEDEREKGLRRILNFGHTLAHAIEKTTGTMHGRAVGVGIEFAARFSVKKGYLAQSDADKIIELGRALGIPYDQTLDRESLKEAMLKDKKREQQNIHFVFLKGIGDAYVESISLTEMEEAIDDLCIYC